MTVKKHTPSGAQSSTSARTTNQPARLKGKPAEGGETVTAERLRAFLANPQTPARAKARAEKLVGQLYEAGEWDTLPEQPEYFGLLFEQTYINDHLERGTAEPAEREIYEKLAAVINQHEPKDTRLVRRLSEVLRATKGDARNRIGELMCDLSNETQVDDLHPDVFDTLARVYIREARAQIKTGGKHDAARLRRFLRELEEIAGTEKGGRK